MSRGIIEERRAAKSPSRVRKRSRSKTSRRSRSRTSRRSRSGSRRSRSRSKTKSGSKSVAKSDRRRSRSRTRKRSKSGTRKRSRSGTRRRSKSGTRSGAAPCSPPRPRSSTSHLSSNLPSTSSTGARPHKEKERRKGKEVSAAETSENVLVKLEPGTQVCPLSCLYF